MLVETADFIQKQGAARRLFHQAGTIHDRTRERALPVSEKGVRKHRVVQTGDIDGNEFSLSSAQLVDHPGEYFLARAAFAGDKDRPLACRNCLNINKYGLHGRIGR